MKIKRILLLALATLLMIPYGTVSTASSAKYDIGKTIEAKTFLKTPEEIDEEFEKETDKIIQELSRKEQEISPNSRAQYVNEIVATNTKWTGYYKAGGQQLGPVSFPGFGGTIYWQPSSGPTVSGSISVSGKIVGFSLGIGSRKNEGVSGYGAHVPSYGSWYLYVNRKVEGRKINIYRIENGRKTLYHTQYSTIPAGVSLDVRQP